MAFIATKHTTTGNEMKWDDINELCDVVRETSFSIHCYHRNGHLEKVYENALVNRLKKKGLKVEQQYPLSVYDEDGTVLGEYYADLFIEGCLIVEIKACKTVADKHVAQLLGYLKSSRTETGLLINFGGPKLYVKKFLMTPNCCHKKHENAQKPRTNIKNTG